METQAFEALTESNIALFYSIYALIGAMGVMAFVLGMRS